MKTLVVLTGPQGAGNHLWSKIFSLHDDVFGWKSLLSNYWEAHRFSEPFADYWRDPSKLRNFNWSQSEYFFTSISVPLGIKSNGTHWRPNVLQFCKSAEKLGIKTQVVVIGRDQNILNNQQQRLRNEPTSRYFLDQLAKFPNPIYLSYELLYLYKQEYLKHLDIGIPIAWYDKRIETILERDANAKYVQYVDENPLDDCNKTGCPALWDPNTPSIPSPAPEKPEKDEGCC
tara:strand:+ start:630 stop:1319 length:690 start_codon:yes stop_codon:yes gene_type:complete